MSGACTKCGGTGWVSSPPVMCTDGRKRCTTYKCTACSTRPIAFCDDFTLADRIHGDERKACIDRLDVESGRWLGQDGHVDARALAIAAWESGWDAAIAAGRER